LELFNVIIANDFFQYSIKLVQDFGPRIEIGPCPFPSVNIPQNLRKVIGWCF
jgi:hypothetical protein